uniref:Zinc finger protein 292b n=1 Tax=Esox lucius TaxID=8010 RepID=A0AAY5KV81_ESOLU
MAKRLSVNYLISGFKKPARVVTFHFSPCLQTLVEYADRWRIEEEPLPLVEVYKVALLSYAQASPCLSSKCENVPLCKISYKRMVLLVDQPVNLDVFQLAHSRLQENGIGQLSLLSAVTQETGVWSNDTLRDVLSDRSPQTEKGQGPVLLEMRVKHLIKENHMERAARLAKACAEYPHFEGKGHFRQMYLVCLCAVSAQEPLIEELSKVDCRDALEMICNLESEGNDRGALSVCSAFLTRQLLQGDSYCAWELTLFWSKLLKRLELSEEMFLDRCCQMSLLSKTVFHILFLIKVIQSEVDTVGLPVCIEMCIRALQLESSDGNNKATICKTISCLLPADLEIKRASQLTEFLLDPTVDSYYAVETLYNEPDQKLEEENLPIPNSLRCELLLVFKTQWPFDPEFWDWKTLKRHCLALMGEEASIVSSIDLLNDSESPEAPEEEEEEDTAHVEDGFRDVSECFIDTTQELNEITDRRQKNRETKKLREKGFISARFRNWQAYMQYCVLCDKEFLGHRIVRHAQTHYKDGFYSCPICAETFTTKDILEPHVASHVKLSCKERLAAIKTNKKLANPKTAAPVIAALKAKTENELWSKDSNSDYQVHNGEFLQTETVQTKFIGLKSESTEENTCPVANCKKGFKYFRNLLVHVKAHGDNDEARRFLEMQSKKVICQYCRRQFVSVTHLNDHLQVHCGVRPYICIQLNCKASFLSNTELLVHRKGHVIFKAKCMFPGCGKIFSEAYKLYDHEAQHYKTFTCKVPECGTVFHSQAQLDLHREEHEVDETSQLSTSIAVKHSIQNLLNASEFPIQNNQEYMIKSDPPDKEMYPFSESSVIRSTTNAQTHNPNKQTHRPLDLSETAEYDFVIPTPQQHNPLSSYQDTGDLGHAMRPNVFQGPVQSVRNDVNYGSTNYNSDYRCALPSANAPQQCALPSANAPQQCALPSTKASQQCTLPSTKAPQQCPLPSTPAQPQGEKERHHCALETCDRNYSSYRSVTKHMKAAHPDFYTEWKIANRKNREQEKAERARKPVLSSVPEIGNSTAVAPLRSQPTPSMPWQQPPENNQIHNSYSPQVYSSDVQGMPLMDTVGGGMDVHVIPSDRMLGSNVQRPIESILPPQRDNHLQPVFPSYMDILKDSSLSNQMENVTPSYTPQIENDPCSKLNPSKKSKGMQKTTKMESNFAPAANLPPKTNRESQDGKVNSGNPENPTIKKVKRNKRTKWPAILKDGKFICSRCGRAFSNPKSLGGHLSKRSHCKAYDETELLTADLPSSFLDLLNSEQLLNTPPTQSLLYNPVTPYANEGKQTDDILKQIMDTPNISNLFESTATPQPLFQNPCGPYGPGGRLPESTVIHHTADIQVKTESESYRESYLQPTMDPGFGNSAFSDPLLSQMLVENNPTVSLHRLPTDHIDHLLRAETLMKMKEVKGSSSESDSGGLSNDGLLAAMASLAQNLMANPMLQVTSPDPQPQHSPAATSSKPLETQRNRTEQNIKKRLREQILAGDFQRRSSLSRASSTDTFASLNPVSSNIATNVMQHFEVNQCSQPSNTIDNIMPVLSAQVNGEAQMQSSTSTQSFTHFREASSQHQEIPAPIDIVANDVDSGPTSIPANQQHWIMDIQTALERLDLDKQVCDFTPTLSSPKPSCTDICKETEVLRPNVSNDKDSYVPDGCRKPFICENDNCNYSAMTKDAILKHLVRAHSYTSEMICLLKKNHGKFAPFSCKMCDKTFTRNSNLRAHCQTAHRMTQQEIAKLKINRQSSNTVGFDISDSKQPFLSVGMQPMKNIPIRDQPLTPLIPGSEYQMNAHSHTTSLDKTPKIKQPRGPKPKVEIQRKVKDKKTEASGAFSPYRPYRCVHHGCTAAFTIQHNLILHYRAVHQSALSTFEGVMEEPEGEIIPVMEFRCQVKDCSRVFQDVPNLLQHYLQLHKFSVDKAGSLLSNINLGRFRCDQQGCTASFTAFWKYIGHIEKEHDKAKLTKMEPVDGMFQCDVEGCDRAYATKSNLLRHTMKKHHELYKLQLMNQPKGEDGGKPVSKNSHYQMTKSSDGKENIESNKKFTPKGGDKRKMTESTGKNHWTKYGKPSLKSKDEASAMCIKKSSLQYPCMIKGCDSVMKSERSIMKHYMGHGLSERYLEEQRSHFIFCKKYPRRRNPHAARSDDSKSESSSEISESEGTADTGLEGSEFDEYSKPVLRRRGKSELSNGKPSYDESSETVSDGSVTGKRKRGRPQKTGFEKIVKRKRMSRLTRSNAGDCGEHRSDYDSSSNTLTQDEINDQSETLTSFKPMGFEMSFLKFLEQSNTSKNSLKKIKLRNATVLCKRSDAHLHYPKGFDTLEFRNPQKLTSLTNVKIVVDKAFSGVADTLLKQLQEMRPTSELNNGLFKKNDDSVPEGQSLGKETVTKI